MQEIRDLLGEVRADPASDGANAVSRLMNYAETEENQHGAIQGMLDLCHERLVQPYHLAACGERLLSLWTSLLDRLKHFQQEPVKLQWLIDSDYEDLSIEAEWFIDLLAYVPGPEVTRALRRASELSDPNLKLFAILSLARRSDPVGPGEIEPVAASRLVRETLWTELRKLGKEHLMPARWSTPASLAESALSRWLRHPNELNAAPEEIQFVEAISRRLSFASKIAPVPRSSPCVQPGEVGLPTDDA